MMVEKIEKPVSANPDALPVRIFLAGMWQIVWVSDVENFIAAHLDLGYDVAVAA